VHEAVRLHGAQARVAVVAAVAKPQSVVVAAGGGDQRQGAGVDGHRRAGQRHGVGVQRVDAAAQPGGQHLLELGEGPD
jgi:hypothetical protein